MKINYYMEKKLVDKNWHMDANSCCVLLLECFLCLGLFDFSFSLLLESWLVKYCLLCGTNEKFTR